MNKQSGLWRFAFKALQNDWRSGESLLLISAIIIAVLAIGSVNLLTNSVNQAITTQSAKMLGGDIQVESSQPIGFDIMEMLQRKNVRATRMTEFSTMVLANDDFLLSRIKAVSNHYPLLGEIEIIQQVGLDPIKLQSIPKPGTSWVEQAVIDRFNLQINDTLQIGESEFRIAGILVAEPDSSDILYSLTPKLIINQSDLAATQVVQPGSRVRYKLQIDSNNRSDEVKEWLQPYLNKHHSLNDSKNAQASFASVLNRTQSFFQIVVIFTFILAGVAASLASSRYYTRHSDLINVLRAFGATRQKVAGILLLQLLILTSIAAIIGLSLATLIESLIRSQYIQPLFTTELNNAEIQTYLLILMSGYLLMLVFALPDILRQLYNIEKKSFSSLLLNSTRLILVIGFIVLITQNIILSLIVISAVPIVSITLSLLVRYSLIFLQKVSSSFLFRLVSQRLLFYFNLSITQLLAFIFSFTAISLIAIITYDLALQWQNNMREDTPNYFAINIQPADHNSYADFLNKNHIEDAHLFPMVRGRLIEINRTSVDALFIDENTRPGALNRELNLSWANNLPNHNKISHGSWWTTGTKNNEISIEEKLAQRLNIKLGDEVGFSIAAEKIYANVTSFRSLKWDSFKPNFFVIFPPHLLKDKAHTYMTSFYNASDASFSRQSSLQFPAVSLIDVSSVIERLQSLLNQVLLLVQLLFIFVLGAGIIVLMASVHNSQDQRKQDAHILNALGAGKHFLQRYLAGEFILLGLICGFFAALITQTLITLLYTYVLNIPLVIYPQLFLLPILGAALLSLFAYLSHRLG